MLIIILPQPDFSQVYGAMMWSLGKVLGTPEVARVYIGSFWDEPLRWVVIIIIVIRDLDDYDNNNNLSYRYDTNRSLFEAEEQDLFSDIQGLPRNAALRKLNDLIKRARLAKVSSVVFNIIYV